MKKLLLITDLYPHRYNPVAGIFVLEQVRELTKYYRIWVVASCFSHPYSVEHTVQEGVDVTNIYFPIWTRFFLSSLITYPLFVLPVLRKVFKQWQPDFIQVHDFRHIPELIWTKTWLDKLSLPKYLTLHNIRTHPDNLMGKPHISLYKSTLGKALRNWDHIFLVNGRLISWLQNFADAHNLSVLGNAINPPDPVDDHSLDFVREMLSEKSFKIISVGLFYQTKGFPLLVSAVKELNTKGFDIQLVIVGEGVDHANIQKTILDLNISDKVWLTGSLANPIVRGLYPLFDAFVLPSYSETFGIVYLEAMYAGLPVVGIKDQGIYGLFSDGGEALFAKAHNINDLEQKIRYLIENPVEARKMAAAGQSKVLSNFMLPSLIENLREVYERK